MKWDVHKPYQLGLEDIIFALFPYLDALGLFDTEEDDDSREEAIFEEDDDKIE